MRSIFALSFTFPMPARIWKLICVRKLKSKKSAEYLRRVHEFLNASPKRRVLSGSPKKRKNPQVQIDTTPR